MHIFFWLGLFVCVDAYAVLQACVRVYVFLLFCCLVHRFSYVLALLTHSGFSLGPVNKKKPYGQGNVFSLKISAQKNAVFQ